MHQWAISNNPFNTLVYRTLPALYKMASVISPKIFSHRNSKSPYKEIRWREKSASLLLQFLSGNCKIEIDGDSYACESIDEALLISVPNAAKIVEELGGFVTGHGSSCTRDYRESKENFELLRSFILWVNHHSF
ncbi:uncharacterized protein LOC109849888 isoform X1 [Asparagus officinalis]|uniref:uncharacterized protein LOC109849888 isoform X1 n=1 Tax=Asparagus officinalis TaxID=4686 RepID=UPI00098E5FE2|nr:uncharacterized protein LOC109849888 isoform X1 [Asparagus officinalis]